MRFTSSTVFIIAPLLSLIPAVTSSQSFSLHAPTASITNGKTILLPTPFPPQSGAPKGLLPSSDQQAAVEFLLTGTSNESIINLEPWYWPKAGCCRQHLDELLDCEESHKVVHYPKNCDKFHAVWESCRMNLGISRSDNQKWQTCFYTPDGTAPPIDDDEIPTTKPRSRLLGPDDTGAMHCLTDLHYRQKSACISLAGSPCWPPPPPPAPSDNNNNNGWRESSWIRTGHLEATRRVSAECSRTMQAAEDSLVGVNVSDAKVVVYATHPDWRLSQQIVFWGPGNYDAECDH